jgi:hypothetical protein
MEYTKENRILVAKKLQELLKRNVSFLIQGNF